MKIALTQREQMVLKALQNGERGIYWPYQGRFNPNAYYEVDTVGRCTREVEKLINKDLAINTRQSHASFKIELTTLGKEFKCQIQKGYDVWIVESDYSIRVSKVIGFMNKKTLVTENGVSLKETHNRLFFLSKEIAYAQALQDQTNRVNRTRRDVAREETILQKLKEEMDKQS